MININLDTHKHSSWHKKPQILAYRDGSQNNTDRVSSTNFGMNIKAKKSAHNLKKLILFIMKTLLLLMAMAWGFVPLHWPMINKSLQGNSQSGLTGNLGLISLTDLSQLSPTVRFKLQNRLKYVIEITPYVSWGRPSLVSGIHRPPFVRMIPKILVSDLMN